MNIVQDYRSEPFVKALALANSQAAGFAIFDTLPMAPTWSSTGVQPDGVFAAGGSGQIAPGRLQLMPFCEGNAGATFSMRVYGWDFIGNPDAKPAQWVWIPYLLAELLCTSCAIAGPPAGYPAASPRALKDSEFLCDTISLTQGTLGLNGLINSTGPGTNLIAYAMVDLAGTQYFQFDFAQTDPVGMNCLWSRA